MKNINKLIKTTILLGCLMVASIVQAQDYKYIIVPERTLFPELYTEASGIYTIKTKKILKKTEIKGVYEFNETIKEKPSAIAYYTTLEQARKEGWETVYPRKTYIVRIKNDNEIYTVPSSNPRKERPYYDVLLNYELNRLRIYYR